MIRLIVLAAFVSTVTTTSIASADRAGTHGTVTAYELDGRTVIDVKQCFRTTRHNTYDYSRCSDRLRDSLKIQYCRARGTGTHSYMFQIGSGRPSRSTIYCSRRY